jgi:hypothetical protein
MTGPPRQSIVQFWKPRSQPGGESFAALARRLRDVTRETMHTDSALLIRADRDHRGSDGDGVA